MFDEKTQQALKAYVYMLLDPKDDKPFYIGKGNSNNRVFEHATGLLEDDPSNSKKEKIEEIIKRGDKVKHVIVRHGLTNKEAFQIEAALIDTLSYCNVLLSNEQGGHHSLKQGLMTTDEIHRLYNAQPLKEMGSDCVLININKQYKRGHDTNDIYQATKGIWLISKNRIPTLKYVLSEFRGLVVEVFEVVKWYQEPRPKNKASRDDLGNKELDERGRVITKPINVMGYSFQGNPAPDNIRNRYINKSVAHIKKRGAAQVIRYKL